MGTLALLLAMFSTSVPDDAIRRATDEVYRDRAYQEMQEGQAPPAEAPARNRKDASTPPPDLPGSGGDLGPLFRFLAWATLIAFAVFAVTWLAREYAPFWPGGPMVRRRSESGSNAGAVIGLAPVAEEARPEFEIHAEQGRFVEAVHALLLAVQWEIGRRRRTPFAHALTSREILHRSGLEGEARQAFDGIIATVETGLFGGRDIGRVEYETCTKGYGRVLSALDGGTA